MEPQRNLVYTFKIKGRKTSITGTLLEIGDEWILLNYIPVDYVIDGYRLVRRKFIKTCSRGKEEEFIEKVLKAKGVDAKNFSFNLKNITDILITLQKKEVVIQFDLYDESISYVGQIIKISKNNIYIKNLDVNGLWMEEQFFKIESIRTIQFENDYIISLVAYNKTLTS